MKATIEAARPEAQPKWWPGEIKDYLVLFPAVVSAIALTYDVGYFTALGMAYFTFFSLSEHLVFALQALPSALIATFAVTTYASVWNRGPIKIRFRLTSGMFAILMCVLAVVFFVSAVYFGAIVLPMVSFVALAFMGVRFYAAPAYFAVGVLIVGALLITWAVGFELALSKFGHDATHVLLREGAGEFDVTLIRSGERGILFYDVTSQRVVFMRWDGIKQIAAKSRTPQLLPPWMYPRSAVPKT